MKRSLLNITMAAFISCFAACSEEEIIATQDGTPKEVTVSGTSSYESGYTQRRSRQCNW